MPKKDAEKPSPVPSATSSWSARKKKPGNRAEKSVHLTRFGVRKLHAIHEFMGECYMNGTGIVLKGGSSVQLLNVCGGPSMAGVMEWGLDDVLKELGVHPSDIIRYANQGKPTIELFREANQKRAADAAAKASPAHAPPASLRPATSSSSTAAKDGGR